MRVVAWNVQGCVRGIDAVAGALRDLAPDIACLSEVHFKHLPQIEKITGRRAIFGPARRVGVFGRFGNAVLARERPHLQRVVRLSRSPGLEQRSLLIVRAGDTTVAATHLGLTSDERLRHANEILRVLPDGPLVFGADLNADPDETSCLALTADLPDTYTGREQDGFTFPSMTPRRRIDYVLARGFFILSCEVPNLHESDHRPVVAELS